MTVIIDPGHGGSDVGATSVDKVYDEKHINLSVAKYLQSYLESAGVNVIMVRDTLEEGSDLTLRGKVMGAIRTPPTCSSASITTPRTRRRAVRRSRRWPTKRRPTKIPCGKSCSRNTERSACPIRSIVFREGAATATTTTPTARRLRFYIPALTSEFCFIDNAEDQQFIDSEGGSSGRGARTVQRDHVLLHTGRVLIDTA